MAKPKFYLEPRPNIDGRQAINMFYSFNGVRLQYYTGVRVEIKYFRPECNTSDSIKPIKTIAKYSAQNNIKLSSIAHDAVAIVKSARGENLNVKYVRDQLDLIHKPKQAELEAVPVFKHTFITFFEQLIADTKSGKRILKKGKNKGGMYSKNALKNYNTSLSAIKRYMKYKSLQTLAFEDLNKSFYNDFRDYCFTIEKKEISTFSMFIKDIKTVMSETDSVDFDIKNYIRPDYDSDNVYLNLEQIERLERLDLSEGSQFVDFKIGQKQGRLYYHELDEIRDLFLIGVYSGLRFSDLSNLKIESVESTVIRVKQIKTGQRVTIPIMNKLRLVLNKYFASLPKTTNIKFNYGIREVARLAELNEIVEIKSTKGNKNTINRFPLYSQISSHTCRRSYATNMFKAGVPPMLIMSATGHKTESSFLKYIKANNEDKAKLLAETLRKLGL
jgi:integrase